MIQRAKTEVFGHFLELVCWIDLILHILVELNVFQHSGTLPGHGGSFKNPQNAFLMTKMPKRGILAVFWTQVLWIDQILLMMIELNEFQCLGTFVAHEGSFKSQKNAFLNDPKYQKGFFWTKVFWIDLILLMMMKINEFQRLG